MSDLISRKALYDKIAELENDVRSKILKTPKDLPAYVRYVERYNELNRLKHEIQDAPTVDAVEVVRCKECKFWGIGVVGETESIKCCDYGRYMVGGNGYCVYGEKKSEVKHG